MTVGNARPGDRMRTALARLPRVDLGVTVTPCEHLSRLSAHLGGPDVYIKRDDLAGGPLGGNKTRMLEYVLGKAIADGADTVVGGSAAQSNYSRQLAAACARLGLECHLVLRRIRPSDDVLQGSLLLDRLYGAVVEMIGDDRTGQTSRLVELAAELERRGRVVYRAPQASDRDKPLHAAAYASGALELLDQTAAAGVDVTHVYVSSLDTTHAGLLLGLRSGGSAATLRAISPNERAIFPDRTIEEEVARLATEAARLLGVSDRIVPIDVDTSTDFVGERYGAITEEAMEAMRLFARTEAIVLDPVYSAKAAAALVADIRSGRLGPDDTVVFWHTGGLPAVFAYADELVVE
ncbi:pyridoxal-phosphate dependent enzyme [Desertimonas flava]|uniref:pyridoxal-phosphate dependent enzyme n=1 Tax=Desertimonas flava TaxID=2064846 RepID=UPI000E3503F8|nr:pyridoxal-phosphate dependent enzyme [Desertimonas flava]